MSKVVIDLYKLSKGVALSFYKGYSLGSISRQYNSYFITLIRLEQQERRRGLRQFTSSY